jgi:hypothetical protein
MIFLGKRVSLKIFRKISFQVSGGQSGLSGQTVRALGADGPRVFDIYLISEVFGKGFRENSLPVGQSAGFRRTVCYLLRNQTELCAARVDRADGPRPTRRQSAGPRRTVCPAQRAPLIAVDFAFLPLEFKREQSARYAFFT